MKQKRKILFALFAIALVGVIVWAFLPKPVFVETTVVSRGLLEEVIRDDGRTRIRDRYLISAPLAGQLQRIEYKSGHLVKEGMVLARIEPASPELLDPRAHAAAEARVHAAEQALQQSKAVLDRATANFEFAQNDLERTRELFQAGTVSTQEMDRAELSARTTEDDLNAAEFGVRISEFDLALAKTALSRGQPGSASRTIEIRAPQHGRILRVFQESAAVLSPGAPIMEVGDPTNLEIEIDVLSSDAVKIPPGAPVVLEHWGGAVPLEARVRLVEPAGFLKISALGVEEQRVWVIADFTSPRTESQNLGDAYRVEARIVTWSSNNVLKVPAGALFRQQENWAVFKVENNRARIQPVRVGHRSENEAELLDGLVEKDRVIVHPSDRVEAGTPIRERTSR